MCNGCMIYLIQQVFSMSLMCRVITLARTSLTWWHVCYPQWGPVGETRAYDIVLDVAMRVQKFQRRNLRLQGSWLWLLGEFASCYGVSESYTKLRYVNG